MRYEEFKLTEEELLEVKMSTSSLANAVKNIDAIAGIEFEMYVPNTRIEGEGSRDEDEEYDPDMDETADGYQDVDRFFSTREMATNNDNGLYALRRDLDEWIDELVDEAYEREIANLDMEEIIRDYVTDELDNDEYDIESVIQDAISEGEGNSYYDGALERYMDENRESIQETVRDSIDWEDERRFFQNNGLNYMSDVAREYNLHWPYQNESASKDMEELKDEFEDIVTSPIILSKKYHDKSIVRDGKSYIIEPDGSLNDPDSSADAGIEFVSPALPLAKMIHEMRNIIDWAKSKGCYTNASTGLHMNISIRGVDHSKMDYVKMALFVGDKYSLEQFNRIGNTFADSVTDKLNSITDESDIPLILDHLKQGLLKQASWIIHGNTTKKYMGLNIKNNRIEVRYPGNDWLNLDFDDLCRFLMRYVVAYDIACSDKNQDEYAKKLYNMILGSGKRSAESKMIADYLLNNDQDEITKKLAKQRMLHRKITSKVPSWEVTFNPNVQDINKERNANIRNTYKYKMAPFRIAAQNAEDAIAHARLKWGMYRAEVFPDFYFKARKIG